MGRLACFMVEMRWAALLPVARAAGIRHTAESGCHLDGARCACLFRTFSTHIKMLSITSNVYYLVPGRPGRPIWLSSKRKYHVEHTHDVCHKICNLNSSIPCLSLFWSAWTMDVDTATLTVYRVIFPTMATRNWFSTCTSQAIIVADNSHRWTRLTMHFVQKFLSISMITSLLSPTIAIDRYLPQSIVTDNMYRCIYPQSINPQWLSMDSLHSLL